MQSALPAVMAGSAFFFEDGGVRPARGRMGQEAHASAVICITIFA
jgi:hypothetical protein